MFLLLGDKPSSASQLSVSVGPNLGVIEEARRRQRARRIRVASIALIVAALIGFAFWVLNGGASHASPVHAADVNRTHAIQVSNRHVAFNERLVPTLTVGQVGWCIVIEEDGRTGGSACGGVPTLSQPILQEQGSYSAGSAYETTVVVTDPQVTTILADNMLRVPTVSLPGLPYGLRGALIRIPIKTPGQVLPGGRLPRLHAPTTTLVALDAQGRALPQRWNSRIPRQASVRAWHNPNGQPQGSCRLHAHIPGLFARSGEVASAIRPFSGDLVGHAFLPCVATVYYVHQIPLKAMVVLDAANPGARVVALPDFKPVPRMPGFFAQGGLTARRSGNAWLIVGQGTGLAERVHFLRHLTATVRL
jgi:hypothetical protein